MKVIGYLTNGYMEWFAGQPTPNEPPPPGPWIYVPEFTGSTPETIDAERWQHVGYVFPNDNGGTIFPNKLTGGKNAVAAYTRTLTITKPDPRDEQIARLEKSLATMNELNDLRRIDYLDRAALAALPAIIAAEPDHTGYDTIATEAYAIADAMLAERERRLGAAPSVAQE